MIKNISIITLTAIILFIFFENEELKNSIQKLEQEKTKYTKKIDNLQKQLDKYSKSLILEKSPLNTQNIKFTDIPYNYRLYLPQENNIDLSKILYDTNRSITQKEENTKFDISPKLIIDETKEDIGLKNIQDLGMKNLGINFKFEKKF